MLEVRLLGGFEIKSDGEPVDLPSRPAQSLFAYLILNAGSAHRREKLAGMFWPASTEERARASLRHELWRIRKAIGAAKDSLVSDDLTVRVDPSFQFELDVRALNGLTDSSGIDELIPGLSHYRGELLPGFYEDWVVLEREHLQLIFEKHLGHLLDLLEAEKRWAEMVDWAERWIALGQNPDAAYRALMIAYGGLGDRAKVIATYDRCVQALHALGLEPSSDLRAMAEVKAPSIKSSKLLGEADAPTGTVTFLFTDIEGSTRISQEHREAWESIRQRHHAILHAAIEAHNGYVFEIVGDAFCAAFNRPAQAVLAAVRAQRDLQAEPWGETPIRVRMGIHTGVADAHEKGYRGYLTLTSVQRVMSAGHGGQILLSQGACELLEAELPNGVGLRDMGQHRLKDLLKPQHLYQLVVADLPAEFPALKTLDRRPHNLPVQLTSFIGREQEIHDLADLIRSSRLVTLTGVGGTGKTRLALQVAADVLQEFPDGAWLTQFAPLSDPDMVPQAIAASLSLKEQPGRSYLEVLKDYLGKKRLLLVLDNCEHLIVACAQVINTLLHAAPEVSILATSREALNLEGEAGFHVRSLPLPPSTTVSTETISQADAIRLFVERAAATQPDFQLSDQNAPTVAQVCGRLDGIPLAIELAAARTRGMTIEQIASRLDDRFHLLADGNRASLPRHRTLQAAIDWSYNLLDDKERILLRRLSVFRGGWTLESASAIAATGELTAEDVIDLLPRLVEKSLITLDLGTGRYGMLETIREYGMEKLGESGEDKGLRARHLEHYLALVEASDQAAMKGEFASAALASELDNLISAINWSAESPEHVQNGLLLVGAARLVWLLAPYIAPAYPLARRLLALPGAEPRNFARCRALLTMIQAAYYSGSGSEVLGAAEESVAIAREIGDLRREAQALDLQGTLLGAAGRHTEGLHVLEQALALARDRGLRRLEGKILGDTADLMLARGDLAGAEKMYAQAIEVQRQCQAPHDLICNLLGASVAAIMNKNLDLARLLCVQVFELMLSVPRGMSDTAPPLHLSACYLASVGDLRHSAVLFGAAERQRELEQRFLEDTHRRLSEPLTKRAREALGESAYREAIDEGRKLTGKEAVCQARAWLTEIQDK